MTGSSPPTVVALRAFALIASCMLSPALALPYDARVRIIDFDPHGVVPLTAIVGYHDHYEFEPDEHIVNLGAGDSSALDVGAEANHLLIKPRSALPSTNLTIITNKRAYFVDYRALGRAPRADEATYSISFRYAATVPAQSDRGVAPVIPSRLDPAPDARNLNYWYCGSPRLRPTAAADDGLQLQLTFAPDTELPAIYALGADGTESLVNTHSERDTVFVHRIAARYVLRRGHDVGCVVDRSERGAIRRAASGTVDAGTQRVLNTGEQ